MADPEPQYHGFLGADAARFPGQSTTDIHFQDLAQPGLKMRPVGLKFIFIEESNAPDGPWATADMWLPALSILNHGPVHPLPQVSP